jgi:predicted amidophosphoribosyltransferase
MAVFRKLISRSIIGLESVMKCKKCKKEFNQENNYRPSCGEKMGTADSKNCQELTGSSFKICRACFKLIIQGESHKCADEDLADKDKGDEDVNIADAWPEECPECNANIEPFMNYCPECCEEITWHDIHGNNECFNCGSEVALDFNYCYACGEWILDADEEPYKPIKKVNGFDLLYECDTCDGLLAEYMLNCPWCGTPQEGWEYGNYECDNCSNEIDEDWTYCPLCGEDVGDEE